MSVQAKVDDERTSLLQSRPTSCYSSHDQHHDERADSPDPPPLNKVSRSDLAWILAGLWSAVFLGALDGACLIFLVVAYSPYCRSGTGTIVATLLTPIGNYFEKANQASYIGTSYLLSVCCFTPLYGESIHEHGARIADMVSWYPQDAFRTSWAVKELCFWLCRFSVRDIFTHFILRLTQSVAGSGTIFCGLAPSMEALIVARAVAGMGGGGCVFPARLICFSLSKYSSILIEL